MGLRVMSFRPDTNLLEYRPMDLCQLEKLLLRASNHFGLIKPPEIRRSPPEIDNGMFTITG